MLQADDLTEMAEVDKRRNHRYTEYVVNRYYLDHAGHGHYLMERRGPRASYLIEFSENEVNRKLMNGTAKVYA